MKKWSGRLAAVLEKGSTPAWRQAGTADDPAAAVAGLVGRARPSTVKKRVRDWEVFARWLQWNRCRGWPASSTDLVDYLAARMAEGCPPSFPEAFKSAVLWVEARSGHDPGMTYGRDEFFRKNVDRASVVVLTDAEAVKKAPRMPIIVIGALECKVMNVDAALGVRVVAWARLLKVFGTLRWDDLQRLRPRDVALRAGGLVGRLSQTKTSGAGKKVRDLPLFIPRAVGRAGQGLLLAALHRRHDGLLWCAGLLRRRSHPRQDGSGGAQGARHRPGSARGRLLARGPSPLAHYSVGGRGTQRDARCPASSRQWAFRRMSGTPWGAGVHQVATTTCGRTGPS